MFVLFFETGWPHGRGLVFREPRILILPCHAASTPSTEHPLLYMLLQKRTLLHGDGRLTPLKSSSNCRTSQVPVLQHTVQQCPTRMPKINMLDGYYNNTLQAVSWGSYERVDTEGTRKWCNYCLMGVPHRGEETKPVRKQWDGGYTNQGFPLWYRAG
jgi:hypothetical protein